jgi:hypothetical protein
VYTSTTQNTLLVDGINQAYWVIRNVPQNKTYKAVLTGSKNTNCGPFTNTLTSNNTTVNSQFISLYFKSYQLVGGAQYSSSPTVKGSGYGNVSSNQLLLSNPTTTLKQNTSDSWTQSTTSIVTLFGSIRGQQGFNIRGEWFIVKNEPNVGAVTRPLLQVPTLSTSVDNEVVQQSYTYNMVGCAYQNLIFRITKTP